MAILTLFLINNGFEYNNVLGNLSNDSCVITVYPKHYEVVDSNKNYFETNGHSLYELIGYLTYHSLMDKDYKKK